MDPVTLAIILGAGAATGAGGGLLKYFLEDKPDALRQKQYADEIKKLAEKNRALNIEQARSSWARKPAQTWAEPTAPYVDEPSLAGNIVKGLTAGLGMGQSVAGTMGNVMNNTNAMQAAQANANVDQMLGAMPSTDSMQYSPWLYMSKPRGR